jgi:hypothetical protein
MPSLEPQDAKPIMREERRGAVCCRPEKPIDHARPRTARRVEDETDLNLWTGRHLSILRLTLSIPPIGAVRLAPDAVPTETVSP